MIKLLTQDKEAEFLSFCNKSINGAVIYTRYHAYKDSQEALFWYSIDANGTINGICSLMDGIFTYDADENCDKEEIEMFASIMGAEKITRNGRYILRFDNIGKEVTAQDITGENLKEIFNVIFEDEPERDKFFSAWYTDASHKIRHSLIHGKGIFVDGKCVSVALTSGENEKIAVISSVATLKNHRKHGYGENAVVSLAASLPKEVFLMTDDDNTARWYQKIGFCITEI